MAVRYRFALILVTGVAASNLQAQSLALPARSSMAATGSEIIAILADSTRDVREKQIFQEVLAGNVPRFLRTLCRISVSDSIGGERRGLAYDVTPDYLALGSDDDYVLMPMTPILAQRVANILGCSLPTKKMTDQIYEAAAVKLRPQPIPPSNEMVTVPVFNQHNDSVRLQRRMLLTAHPLGTLVAGHKKDVIVSNRIREGLRTPGSKPVVIYGWHQTNGIPIQPLYNGHGESYTDYSHGIRLVANRVFLDGAETTLAEILADSLLCRMISHEGMITAPWYSFPDTLVNPN